MEKHTTLLLHKQNFKFSAAHFLIFDENHAERLHGHNYKVAVDLLVPRESEMQKKGYFFDLNIFKKQIKEQLDKWDEYVLLPENHPDMKIAKKGSGMEVRFRERYYVFPANEVVLLPITNTSVEQLSILLAEAFLKKFTNYGVKQVRVRVFETDGQGAATVCK